MSAVRPARPVAELFGLPTQPTSARDRLVHTAVEMFYARGFNAVGLDQIIAEVGVTKTTFYRHFASKDDLMVEAVRQRDAWEEQAWRHAVEELAGDDPRAQLLAFIDVMDIWFNDPDFRGCIFINTAAEFPNPHDPIHEAAAAHKRKARDAYRDLAKAAGATDPETFADRYALLVEGTLIMRQVHGRDDAARLARPMAKALLDEFIPLAAV